MARGCVFQPSYTVTLPDGSKETRKSPTFWIQYRDGQGIKRREPVSEEKKDADEALDVANTRAIKERAGLPTQNAAALPIRELVKEYLDAQRARVTPHHLENISQRIDAVVKGTKAVTVKDLSPEKVENFLSDFAEGEPENEIPPPAGSTVNGYLQAVKALLAWAVQRRKLPYNPLAGVKRRAVTEKARNRRPLTEIEAANLLSAALEGPSHRAAKVYKGAPIPLQVQADCARQGRRNALAYRIMLTTGLRLHEVRELKWTDINLEAAVLFIRGDKGDKLTGRVEEKELPLPPDTMQALAAWKAETRPDESALVAAIPARFVDTLASDLEAAGVKHPDAAGRVVDCHSLRHTFGTWLGKRPDVDPKTIQALMRHKTAALTFGVYVHRDKGRMKAAAAAMPALAPLPFKPETVKAASLRTGTDDMPIDTQTSPNISNFGARLVQEGTGRNPQALVNSKDSLSPSSASQPEDAGSNPAGDTIALHTKPQKKGPRMNAGLFIR